MVFERIEDWLDQGAGSCVLSETRFSLQVHQSMQYFNGRDYELGASVIMPNHVHCIVRPYPNGKRELEELIGSWKSFTSKHIHLALAQSGKLWQEESYDRIIRDEEHLWRCLQYIGRNPEKAGKSNASCQLWLNPDWEKLGWRYESNE